MSKNLGIVVPSKGSGKLAPAKPVDLPQPGEGELLLKVEAAAQNPVDAMQADLGFAVSSFPTILGVDASGTVVSLGPGVSGFSPGDRVASMTPLGRDAKYGVYQQYCVARSISTIHIPASLSFDEAASLPLAFYTAALGIFSLLGVPIPLEGGKLGKDVGADEWFLVWGASSSVGAVAVQLAKVAGFNVIATASKANFDYVKSLGADVVLDYKDPKVVEQIQATASISLAYDSISQPTTTNATITALSPEGGKVATTLPYSGAVPDKVELQLVQSGSLATPELAPTLKGLTELWQVLVSDGKLKPNPVKIMPNGLDSIDEGFEMQRQHKISAQKLIYHPQETKA